MKIIRLPYLILLLLLTACGGTPANPNSPSNPANPGSPTTVNKVGVVGLAGPTGGANTSFDRWSGGGFFQQTTAAPSNPYEPTDLCAIAEVPSNTTPTNPAPSPTPVYLDAGDALTLRRSGSTYIILPKELNDKGEIGYSATAPVDVPTGTITLDIPGSSNGFPAFSNLTMPSVVGDFSFTPASGAITADTRFTWTGSSPGAMVLFGNGTGDSGNTVYLFCSLKDDGEYEFPADIKSRLTGFSGKWGVAYRVNSRIETKGDAALILLVYRFKSFATFPNPTQLETFLADFYSNP